LASVLARQLGVVRHGTLIGGKSPLRAVSIETASLGKDVHREVFRTLRRDLQYLRTKGYVEAEGQGCKVRWFIKRQAHCGYPFG